MDMKQEWMEFWKEEDGMSTVEVVLIIAVLVILVATFKTQVTGLISKWFKKISSGGNSIVG